MPVLREQRLQAGGGVHHREWIPRSHCGCTGEVPSSFPCAQHHQHGAQLPALPLRHQPPQGWCAVCCLSRLTEVWFVVTLVNCISGSTCVTERASIFKMHKKTFSVSSDNKNLISVWGGGGGGDGNRLTIFPWRLCVSDVDIVSLLMVWMWCWHFLSPYGVCVMLTFSLSLQSVCGVDMFSVLAACVWCWHVLVLAACVWCWHVLCPCSLCVVLTCSLSLQLVCGVDMFSVLAACVWCWHVLVLAACVWCWQFLCPCSLCVRVVRSNRSGVGKTLYKQRLTTRLKQNLPRERRPVSITIPLHGRVALTHDIAACLLKHTLEPGTILPRIVHLDISYQVWYGCCMFIFVTPPPPPYLFNEVRGYVDIAVSVGASVNLSGFVQKVASEPFTLLSSNLVWW